MTKGDVLGARRSRRHRQVATGCQPWLHRRPPGAPLPAVAAPVSALDLGDRPEQRVPMSRLRARIAERLVQSQSTNAILTTFNEVNMAPGDGDAQALPGAASRRSTASRSAS